MNLVLKYRASFIALLAGSLLGGWLVEARSAGTSEYDVKAAFLYDFAKFIEWPSNTFASTNAPLLIGVYGKNPFHNRLASVVHGLIVDGHPVITRSVSFNQLGNCQILFICASEEKNLNAILRKLDGSSVLTVMENMDPYKSGIMINFIKEDDEVHFEINDAAAKRVRLKISSKLLNLATRTATSRKTDKNQALLCEQFL